MTAVKRSGESPVGGMVVSTCLPAAYKKSGPYIGTTVPHLATLVFTIDESYVEEANLSVTRNFW